MNAGKCFLKILDGFVFKLLKIFKIILKSYYSIIFLLLKVFQISVKIIFIAFGNFQRSFILFIRLEVFLTDILVFPIDFVGGAAVYDEGADTEEAEETDKGEEGIVVRGNGCLIGSDDHVELVGILKGCGAEAENIGDKAVGEEEEKKTEEYTRYRGNRDRGRSWTRDWCRSRSCCNSFCEGG